MKRKPLIIAFGSRTTGRSRAESDFDFGVLLSQPLTLSQRTAVSERIAKKLNINEDKIDIADLYHASPILEREAALNGRLVAGNQLDFLKFKIRAMRHYRDTAKFRKLREQTLKRYVKRFDNKKA